MLTRHVESHHPLRRSHLQKNSFNEMAFMNLSIPSILPMETHLLYALSFMPDYLSTNIAFPVRAHRNAESHGIRLRLGQPRQQFHLPGCSDSRLGAVAYQCMSTCDGHSEEAGGGGSKQCTRHPHSCQHKQRAAHTTAWVCLSVWLRRRIRTNAEGEASTRDCRPAARKCRYYYGAIQVRTLHLYYLKPCTHTSQHDVDQLPHGTRK